MPTNDPGRVNPKRERRQPPPPDRARLSPGTLAVGRVEAAASDARHGCRASMWSRPVRAE